MACLCPVAVVTITFWATGIPVVSPNFPRSIGLRCYLCAATEKSWLSSRALGILDFNYRHRTQTRAYSTTYIFEMKKTW